MIAKCREILWSAVAERVRSDLAAVADLICYCLGVRQRSEDVQVQKLVRAFPVRRFDMLNLNRFFRDR